MPRYVGKSDENGGSGDAGFATGWRVVMAKFIINKDTDYERSVEAEDYSQGGGYFWFRNVQGEDVLTLREKDVYSIQRAS
ncbi:hypothetical protein AB1285_03260 [Microbacterium sp. NRRL B-14842]|uniref:hypothetical protein n=1 Tax=Microbacterium sp. NRRL B-14842 TaxID=3162881 RepID=UPI003511AF81